MNGFCSVFTAHACREKSVSTVQEEVTATAHYHSCVCAVINTMVLPFLCVRGSFYTQFLYQRTVCFNTQLAYSASVILCMQACVCVGAAD